MYDMQSDNLVEILLPVTPLDQTRHCDVNLLQSGNEPEEVLRRISDQELDALVEPITASNKLTGSLMIQARLKGQGTVLQEYASQEGSVKAGSRSDPSRCRSAEGQQPDSLAATTRWV
ncbi:uncharacterized protein [Littorina saxatilis]|uniref:uncharacterized protein isoform X2 n=1 Tax=Littorina saxatilis TaxID=31220 RepID=UPI0038B482B7